MRILAKVARILTAGLLVAAAATTSASALDLGGLFKGKQLDAHPVAVDADAAMRILSNYRHQHGLGAVTLDPTLTRIAADHALKMAETGKLSHVVRGEGSFARRLRTGGYDAAIAAENIGGGYLNLDMAFAGWRESKGHNENMLKPDITVMGIARADSSGSKYGAYWSLVVARPYEPPPAPSAGPPVLPGGVTFGR